MAMPEVSFHKKNGMGPVRRSFFSIPPVKTISKNAFFG
jgi:hypothetical protein